MHFGEFSSEEWSKVVSNNKNNTGSSQDSRHSCNNTCESRSRVPAEDSPKLENMKGHVGLQIQSEEENSTKYSVHLHDDQLKDSLATWNSLQRLSTILCDVEMDKQIQEKALFQAAMSQGIGKESCIYYIPRGIVNRGNTCYISSVLQALLAVNSFRLFFLYLLHTMRQATKENIISWEDFSLQFPLVQKLCHLVEQCMLGGNDSTVSEDRGSSIWRVATRWNKRKESVQAMVSRISKNPISVEDWFQWKPNEYLRSRQHVLSWDNNNNNNNNNNVVREGSVQQSKPNENPNFASSRLNSFLALIFGGNQEDSQEFLIHMLNELHEELRSLRKYLEKHLSSSKVQAYGGLEHPESNFNSKLINLSISGESENEDTPWEEVVKKGKSAIIRPFEFQLSWISFIFGGILRSDLHRIGFKSSVSREPFLFLELDIQNSHVRSLYDALRIYMEPESLDGVVSETTKQKVHARKQVTIERLPRVLILQLKRFTMRNGDQCYRKLGKHVDFPVDLCLPSMLLTYSRSYAKPQNRSYSLAAVVTHLGRELVGGHYICDIRWRVPPRDGLNDEIIWLNCDDSCITCISEKVVLDRQAYLLFYIKNEES